MATKLGQNDACPVEDGKPDEPLVMEPQGSRVAAAVIVWIIGLGVTAVTGAIVWSNLGRRDMMGVVCPGIFLLIGIAIVLGAIYLTLQCFNPMPVIVFSQRFVYPGSEIEVSWMFRGNTKSISKLTITIEGTERASYREGTSTRSEEAIFFSEKVCQTEDAEEIAKGFSVVTLPDNVMHTFHATNNQISWRVKVAGAIRNWPDIDDAFPFKMLAPTLERNES